MAKKVVDIGSSEKNTDWIKTGKGYKGEKEIHEKIARELGDSKKKPPNGR